MKYRDALEKLLSDSPSVIQRLVLKDDLEVWANIAQEFSHSDRAKLFEVAQPQWIERKINDGTLLLHPEVKAELISRNYKPRVVHCQMIWASVLVTYEGGDSRLYYQRIKEKIINKHSNKWWFQVHKRVDPTFKAYVRIKKQNLGRAGNFLAQNSSFLGDIVNESIDDALRMIPKQ